MLIVLQWFPIGQCGQGAISCKRLVSMSLPLWILPTYHIKDLEISRSALLLHASEPLIIFILESEMCLLSHSLGRGSFACLFHSIVTHISLLRCSHTLWEELSNLKFPIMTSTNSLTVLCFPCLHKSFWVSASVFTFYCDLMSRDPAFWIVYTHD